jgi:hypothetical protein
MGNYMDEIILESGYSKKLLAVMFQKVLRNKLNLNLDLQVSEIEVKIKDDKTKLKLELFAKGNDREIRNMFYSKFDKKTAEQTDFWYEKLHHKRYHMAQKFGANKIIDSLVEKNVLKKNLNVDADIDVKKFKLNYEDDDKNITSAHIEIEVKIDHKELQKLVQMK